MALRIEKAFGPSMDHLMRMQLAYDLAHARQRSGIKVARYQRKAGRQAQPTSSRFCMLPPMLLSARSICWARAGAIAKQGELPVRSTNSRASTTSRARARPMPVSANRCY